MPVAKNQLIIDALKQKIIDSLIELHQNYKNLYDFLKNDESQKLKCQDLKEDMDDVLEAINTSKEKEIIKEITYPDKNLYNLGGLIFKDDKTNELHWFESHEKELYEIIKETPAGYTLKIWKVEEFEEAGDKQFLKLVETNKNRRIRKKKKDNIENYKVNLSSPLWYNKEQYIIDSMYH